jgi:hypothetical protein
MKTTATSRMAVLGLAPWTTTPNRMYHISCHTVQGAKVNIVNDTDSF